MKIATLLIGVDDLDTRRSNIVLRPLPRHVPPHLLRSGIPGWRFERLKKRWPFPQRRSRLISNAANGLLKKNHLFILAQDGLGTELQ